ncbi:MAG: PAS domain-containing protein, partial [Hafnia sp.]
MTPANTQSVLMQIQPTILRFTKMLSSVLQLEVEIVDATMTRVAGTGPYGKFFGRKLNSNSCSSKDNCKEKAFLGTPILFQGNCIGVISLVAFTQEQQERIKDNLHEFSDYVRHISNIFVSKLLESQGGNDGASKILLSLIENMDQGVLVLDENNQAQFANATALKQLNAINEQVIGKTFNIRPLTYQQNYLSGHLQHIVAFDQHQELIIGQLHDIQDHQLFLMAFHQSHSPMNVELNPDDPRIEHLVGECRPMRNLKRLISRIAP